MSYFNRPLRNSARHLSNQVKDLPWLHQLLKGLYLALPLQVRGELMIHDYLSTIAKKSSGLFFVQIGANDGKTNDPVFHFAKKYGWNGLLVEPLPQSFAELQDNYSGLNMIFENVAISSKRETRNFYCFKDLPDTPVPKSATRLGSFDKDVILKTSIEIEGLDRHFCEVQISCISMAELLETHHVQTMDLLVIDTEGYDAEILRQLDFKKVDITAIIFEHKHLTQSDRDWAHQLLEANGYSLKTDKYDVLAVKQLQT